MKTILFGLLALVFSSIMASAQIQAGKSINITISGVPESDKGQINGLYPVSEGGIINMPHIGQVQAAGLRPEALASILQSRFKSAQIFTNPTIQVINNVIGAGPNQEVVTVGGDVRSPGPKPFTPELTLWGAIQAAGGQTEFGAINRVKLTRNGAQKSYDVTQPQFKQIPLQRNDAIEVPRKNIFNR
jgi:protein involved in polysaccharide export with SLBB domain